MHGMIFMELNHYVTEKLGKEAWNELLKQAGKPGVVYMPIGTYPDEDIVVLVGTASKITGKPVMTLLEDFGEYIAPHLMLRYATLIKPGWKTLDVLENTEKAIHVAVRARDQNATPPKLICNRVSPTEVHIDYSSQRKMCGVAKGIIRGVAAYMKETVTLSEPNCMHRGDAKCQLVIKKP